MVSVCDDTNEEGKMESQEGKTTGEVQGGVGDIMPAGKDMLGRVNVVIQTRKVKRCAVLKFNGRRIVLVYRG